MRPAMNLCIVSAAAFAFAQLANAADDPTEVPDKHCAPATQPEVALQALLRQVAEHSTKRFIVGRTVPLTVVTGDTDSKPVTYPILLSILRNNGLAAVTVNGVVNVVPEDDVRQLPTPTITGDDATIADDEWVTELVRPKFLNAVKLVPILRPLVPRAGHLAAFADENTLIVTDRYGNLRRLVAFIRVLDKPPVATPATAP